MEARFSIASESEILRFPGLGLLVEVDEIRARDLVEDVGIVGALLALFGEFGAGFLRLAFAEEEKSFAQGAGLFGKRNDGELMNVVILPSPEGGEEESCGDQHGGADPSAIRCSAFHGFQHISHLGLKAKSPAANCSQPGIFDTGRIDLPDHLEPRSGWTAD